jgi:hypothetical protein
VQVLSDGGGFAAGALAEAQELSRQAVRTIELVLIITHKIRVIP